MKNKILLWEVFGAIFLILFGSFLHFTYELSDYNPLVGLFSGVNESVWEHLKLGFWAMVPFMTVEYVVLRKEVNNFFFAKASGIIALQLIITIPFYLYTWIIGEEYLILDIILYIIGSITAQIISYSYLRREKLGDSKQVIAILFFIFHAVILWLFTYYPPELGVFKEDHSNRYGTEWDYHPSESEHKH